MITSRANDRVRFIRELRKKKVRDETGLFYVEGIRLVIDALDSGWKIDELIYSPELLKSKITEKALEDANRRGIPILEVSEKVFLGLSDKDGPQGFAAVVNKKNNNLKDQNSIIGIMVGLELIQDPGNLGTILRTMDAAGVSELILIGKCVDPFSVEAVRASMGAIFAVDIIFTDEIEFTEWVKLNQITLVGTSDKAPHSYRYTSYPDNMILLMGSEQKGLSESIMKTCSEVVSIPMRGKSDSLNLAVATGIILYEITSRRNSDIPSERVKP